MARKSACIALALIGLAGVFTTSAGKTQTDVPLGIAGFAFFRSVVDESNSYRQAAISKIVEATGVNEKIAGEYLSYMRTAQTTGDGLWRQLAVLTCSRRNELSSISVLAQALADEDAAYELGRARIVRNSESVLGAEGMRRLESWLKKKNEGRKFSQNDYFDLLPKSRLSPPEFLEKKCAPNSH